MHSLFLFVPVKPFVKDYSGFFGLKENPEAFFAPKIPKWELFKMIKKTFLTMIQTEINVNLANIAIFSCHFDCLKKITVMKRIKF
jgi:hypothetical protein